MPMLYISVTLEDHIGGKVMITSNIPNILVVDDEFFFRQILTKMLTDDGYIVVAEAADGDEAVVKFREFTPDLVFMDIYMPNKNGIEATKEIISINSAAKIIICSGTGYDDDIEAALKAGARGVIFKPFDDAEIMQIVRNVIAC
jgi:two-component system chemotaxis response regulator CheY